LSGYWSRRIDDEHRLVYRADNKEVKILKARYLYSDERTRRAPLTRLPRHPASASGSEQSRMPS
jgi:hypothetical protein